MVMTRELLIIYRPRAMRGMPMRMVAPTGSASPV
jgi:hypothetical protein